MIYGDGEQSRDFVYVADIVAALLAATGRNGGPYNVGSGVGTSVSELLRRLRRRRRERRRAAARDPRASATSAARCSTRR